MTPDGPTARIPRPFHPSPTLALLASLTAIATTGTRLLAAQTGTTIGGYGEVHYLNPSGPTPGRANVARFVIFLGHHFSDRFAFRSELEVEDARVEGAIPGGEVSLEQLYLDYQLGARTTLRAGLVLVPIGILNETHEPNTFNGVDRPLYHQVILPTTWREIGLGLAGSLGTSGFAYRAYLLNGLRAEGFSQAEGIREGRGEGSNASYANVSLTGRLEYSRPGLKIGAAAVYGGTADTVAALGSGAFAAPVTTLAADLRWERGGFALRSEAATISIPDADKINARFGEGVAERIRGWYVEGAYDLLGLVTTSSARLLGFGRFEQLDTQSKVSAGASPDLAFDRKITTVGLTFKPLSSLAFKADYQWRRNAARVGPDQVVSLGIGYQF